MFDISKATVDECKAVAYDILVQIDRLQKDLQLLNQAISEKSKEPKIEEKKEEPKKEDKK